MRTNSYAFSLKIGKWLPDADHRGGVIRASSLVSEDKPLRGRLWARTAGETLCVNKVRRDPHSLPIHMPTVNRSKSHLALAFLQPSDESVYQNHCQVNVVRPWAGCSLNYERWNTLSCVCKLKDTYPLSAPRRFRNQMHAKKYFERATQSFRQKASVE